MSQWNSNKDFGKMGGHKQIEQLYVYYVNNVKMYTGSRIKKWVP